MTETKNYGLKLPDLTDPADIGVLNENFEKIDEGLARFYDLDLREVVTYAPESGRGVNSFYLNNILDSTTLETIAAVMEAKRNINLQFKMTEEFILGSTLESDTTVMLNNYKHETLETFAVMGVLLPVYTSGIRRSVTLMCNKDEDGNWKVYLYFYDAFSNSTYSSLDFLQDVELSLEHDASQEIDVTSVTDITTLISNLNTARDNKLVVRVETAGGYYVLMPDFRDVSDAVFTVSGIATHSEDAALCHKAQLVVDTENSTAVFYWNAIQSGSGGSETTVVPTNVSVVKSDSTVTITTTLEGDKQSVTTITVDENDYPTSINTDGVEWPVTWEGF